MNIDNFIFWTVALISMYYSLFLLYSYLFLKDETIEVTSKNKIELPHVSIAIPAKDEEKTIKNTIEAVLSLRYPRDKIEIILINDGSRDKTLEIMKEIQNKYQDRNIKIINNKTNLGKANSLNKALNIAKGKLFATVDADSYPLKDSLINVVPYFKNNKVGGVCGLMQVASTKTLLQYLQYIEYTLHAVIKHILSKLQSVHVLSGPFSVYKTKILKELGGFDPNCIVEDQDVTFRLQKRHYKVLQINNAIVKTEVPSSLKQLYYQRIRWYKGSLECLWRYREMIFNKKYGDFGMFHLPMLLTSMILPFFILYFLIKKLWIFLNNFTLTSKTYLLDIHAYVNFSSIEDIYYNIYLKLFQINFIKWYILLIILLNSLYLLSRIYKLAIFKKANINLKMIIYLILFYGFYYILLSIYLFMAHIIFLKEKILKNKQNKRKW